MSDAGILTQRLELAAHRLMPRRWPILWLGLGLLSVGLIVGNAALTLGTTMSAMTLFALVLIATTLNHRYLSSDRHFHESLDAFVHHDATPTICADEDGQVLYANRAARRRFSLAEDDSLVVTLGRFAANPVGVLARLQHKARQSGSAREDVVAGQTHLRLSVNQAGRGAFVWRVENLIEATPEGASGAGGFPMLLATPGGSILHMNAPLHALAGRNVGHLDRLFEDLPLKPNGLHRMTTANGPVDVRVVEYVREGGRREVLLIPATRVEATQSAMGAIFDDLPIGLLKLDAAGRVVAANRAARRLTGHSLNSEVALGDLVRGLGRPVDDWLADGRAGRGLGRTEVVQSALAETEVYLQITLTRVDEAGQVFLVAVLNDATELKTLEAQFVQSQKMQAIGQLAGGIAHDFNNLLTAISGYCDLLLLRHDAGDPDYADLVQIAQNANRAASLVAQLLAFSRKQNLQPETLDLSDALGDVSHLLNRLLGEKVRLQVDVADDLRRVRADRRQLEQVLMNLVVNARDAMASGGGEVKIVAENLDLKAEMQRDRAVVPAGRYVELKVSDSGHGIPPERIGKIFEPFFTTKKAGEGTGLGLSMVYGIVKQSGGYIFVDSAPGQGSVFRVVLPAQVDAAPAKIVAEKNAPDDPVAVGDDDGQQNGVVLLVEDEAPVRAFAARALRMRGHTVIEAGDGEAALGLLSDPDLAVDVFVTDVIMPGRDGPSWVREALERRPGVKTVFVSGYAEESVSGRRAGIENAIFLPKPFSLNDLAKAVQGQLSAA